MLAALSIICAVQGIRVQAGGPLIVQGGAPGRWAGTISFALDQGPLGHLSHAQAAELMRTAVSNWEAVEPSSVDFQEEGPLPLDVTGANILEFFGGNPIVGGEHRTENPIIFDHDGSVIDLLLGDGSSSAVLGFAGPRFIRPSTNEFISAFAVFNGLFSSSPKFASTVVHEFGHLIGLDHTQANRDLAVNNTTADNHLVPLMYPFALDDATERPLRDDEAWLAWMEPEEGFAAATGRIRGRIFRRGGAPLPGANVVAVQVDASLRESSTEVVSCVSGFMLNGGEYEIPGLTPGNYVVFIEPLDARFVGGSSVGPYDIRFDDFPKDYFNGADESASSGDDPVLKTVLTVAAGQTLEGIDLFANEPNLPPVVDAGADRTVPSGQIVQLIATAEDPDGDSMTFQWTQINGLPVQLSGADRLSASFTAPGVLEPVALVFEFTAHDGQSSASDQVRINIIPAPGNSPPHVNAGPDQVATQGQTVYLAGTASDPDGDFLQISWRQLSGPVVQLDGADALLASFVAPHLDQTRQLVFELKASDGRGGVSTDSVMVTVLRNRPPTLRVVPLVIAEAGETVVLEAEAVDPDGDALSFEWSQTEGQPVELEGADTPRLTFATDPDLEYQLYSFRVTVSDGGATDAAAVSVLVTGSPAVVMPANLNNGGGLLKNAFVSGAVVNTGSEASAIHVRRLNPAGQQVDAVRPGGVLAPGGQMAFLARELNPSNQPGTLQLRGLSAPLQGFFLLGELSHGRLDGVGGVLAESKNLHFSTVFESESQTTWINLVNPDRHQAAEVTLRVHDPFGEVIGESEMAIAAEGSLSATIGQLLEPESAVEGYLEVESSIPLMGIELIASADSFVALEGHAIVETERLCAPHFFTDGLVNNTILRLLNLGANPMLVRVTAYDDSSQELGSREYDVQPAAQLNVPVRQVLSRPVAGRLVSGYLDLEVSGGQAGPLTVPARLVGDILFSGNAGRTQAGLPLAVEPSGQTSFLHVAQSAEAHFFQGLVILNTNSEPALVEIQAFGTDGALTAEAEVEVPAGGRVIDLLNSELYFGPDFDQAGGHLQLTSSLPVFSLSLFGDFDGEFLAAVEGQQTPSDDDSQ